MVRRIMALPAETQYALLEDLVPENSIASTRWHQLPRRQGAESRFGVGTLQHLGHTLPDVVPPYLLPFGNFNSDVFTKKI